MLSLEGPLKKLALEDADVRRAVDLTRESYAASPSYTAAALTYVMLRGPASRCRRSGREIVFRE